MNISVLCVNKKMRISKNPPKKYIGLRKVTFYRVKGDS